MKATLKKLYIHERALKIISVDEDSATPTCFIAETVAATSALKLSNVLNVLSPTTLRLPSNHACHFLVLILTGAFFF